MDDATTNAAAIPSGTAILARRTWLVSVPVSGSIERGAADVR
jgi:hypothetical protein